jgi:hypothetical protein
MLKLPYSIRNELLIKLADNREISANVAYAVSKSLDNISEKIRKEILKVRRRIVGKMLTLLILKR